MSKRPIYETFPEFIPDNKLYRWNHGVSKGGFYFVLATKERNPIITEDIKNRLFENLQKEAINLRLVDTTIKVFPTFFVIFTVFRATAHPQDFVDRILNIANSFEIDWDHDYLFSTISDVGTNFIENNLLDLLNKINKKSEKINPNENLIKFMSNET